MDILAVDLRSALRILRRSPGFAATVVVSLAVGIAAATGLFSVVNAALLNPFPFADVNRIVTLGMIDKGKPRGLFVTARQLVVLGRVFNEADGQAGRAAPAGRRAHLSVLAATLRRAA